jgi:hypothetical protein
MHDGIAGHSGYTATARRRDDDGEASRAFLAPAVLRSNVQCAAQSRFHPDFTQEVAPNENPKGSKATP